MCMPLEIFRHLPFAQNAFMMLHVRINYYLMASTAFRSQHACRWWLGDPRMTKAVKKLVSCCSKRSQLATSILLGPHSSSLHQWPELRSPWSILSTTLTQGAVLAKPLNSNCNTVITFNNIYKITIYLHYLHYAVYNVVTYLHVQVSEVLMRSKSLSPSWTQ